MTNSIDSIRLKGGKLAPISVEPISVSQLTEAATRRTNAARLLAKVPLDFSAPLSKVIQDFASQRASRLHPLLQPILEKDIQPKPEVIEVSASASATKIKGKAEARRWDGPLAATVSPISTNQKKTRILTLSELLRERQTKSHALITSGQETAKGILNKVQDYKDVNRAKQGGNSKRPAKPYKSNSKQQLSELDVSPHHKNSDIKSGGGESNDDEPATELSGQVSLVDNWPAHGDLCKPALMLHLECYIKDELAALRTAGVLTEEQASREVPITPMPGVDSFETYSEARFQVFRNVFEGLCGNFRTYQEILASIKYEYEKALLYYRIKGNRCGTLEAKLSTLQDAHDAEMRQHTEKMIESTASLQEQIDELKNSNRKLMMELASAKRQIDEYQESTKLMQSELTTVQNDYEERLVHGTEIKQHEHMKNSFECRLQAVTLQKDAALDKLAELEKERRSLVDMSKLKAAKDEVATMRAETAVWKVGNKLDPNSLNTLLKVAQKIVELSGNSAELERIMTVLMNAGQQSLGKFIAYGDIAGLLSDKFLATDLLRCLLLDETIAEGHKKLQFLRDFMSIREHDLCIEASSVMSPQCLAMLLCHKHYFEFIHSAINSQPTSLYEGSDFREVVNAAEDTKLLDVHAIGREALKEFSDDEILVELKEMKKDMHFGGRKLRGKLSHKEISAVREFMSSLEGQRSNGSDSENLESILKATVCKLRYADQKVLSASQIVQNLLDINETMVDDEGRLPSHREKVKKILESLGDKSDSRANDGERDVQKHIIWSKLFHKFDGLFSRAEELEDELILLRPPDVEQGHEGVAPDWTREKFFQGRGVGASIPKFLRTKGRVRNRMLPKAATESMIKEIWRDKLSTEENFSVNMEDFFYMFLQKRYGIHTTIVEWGYNMLAALERYKYDADCELFLKVLNGEVGQEVYESQMILIDEFLNDCRDLDLNEGGKIIGRVPKKEFMNTLQTFFSDKSSDQINELTLALERDQPGNWVMYKKLFTEDREFNQGFFAEALRDQHLREREKFIHLLDECLTEECTSDSENINVLEAKNGILKAEPSIESNGEKLNTFLCRGFDLDETELANPETLLQRIPVRTFMLRIKMGSHPKQYNVKVSKNDAARSKAKEKVKRSAIVMKAVKRLSLIEGGEGTISSP